MNRSIVRAAAALGCAVLVSGATAAAVELSGDGAPAAPSTQAGAPTAEVLKYWSDTKSALSPLLLYVRILPETIRSLEKTNGRTGAGPARQATDMAEAFATARDLVGRLPVPSTVTADVGELLQIACQLYRQSALALTDLDGSAATSGPAVLRRAASLHLIGDRLIDQARRVLNIDGATPAQAPVELRYAPAVPSISEVTGSPAVAGPTAADLDRTLDAARHALAVRTTQPSRPGGSGVALSAVAGALEMSFGTRAEDVTGARLAILLAVIADQAEADGNAQSAGPLLLLSNDLWNTARTLTDQPHPALAELGAPILPRARVWTGGVFNGKPPALKPGDDVGAGVPGGLPGIDIAAILRG